MSRQPHILITDDEKSIRNILRDILEFEKYSVLEAENGEEALSLIGNEQIDLVILDIKMKGMDGIEVLERIKERIPELPVIMISGHGTIQIAVDAAKKGAFDFVEKPPDLNRLLITVRNALQSSELIRENRQMRAELHGAKDIIGNSPVMDRIRKTIGKIAASSSRVLITGENGTGKELVARSIHNLSKRSSKKFVDVNCAAIPSELLESELFGHEKGAFTGASERRIGKFEQADGGTLFLDEIGDMSQDAQAKVLRALQENQIVRVGGSETIDVDVRIISATNKNLQEEIENGRFREDLYHRLSVIPIQIPPLRKRKEDIPLLAKTFLARLGKEDIVFSGKEFSDEALEVMKGLSWTGNIRELQNAVERLALLSPEDTITAQDVESLVVGRTSSKKVLGEIIDDTESFQEYKEHAERLFLIKKLEKYDWNVSATAEAIDIQRSHIYNKMKKYDIER
ncbi:sigma-54-dependent transcriptional regulator [Rhodohalobacter mucosus]|uniref:Fis family transcriptional regulator n=1 Tax=Rhodohalobacter mucosus TaxID=2079485 RepID=A0A316TRP7_9BACT|nr:sigma-54 dependent transcriptional regulator [Rhodohalobacter mucosus]PWN07257.1 Fis family transcriptional regulator [Rhodohalobacter mucosus]